MSSRLEVTQSLSEIFNITKDYFGLTDNGKKPAISRVTLWLDNDHCVTSGDDTGTEIEADCPYATQAMADAVLASVQGYEYQAYQADAANLDPSAELGDAADCYTLYSVIADIGDNGDGYPDISAPGEREIEEEYPEGSLTQQFSRQIATTRSLITKTANEIRLEVDGIDGELAALTTTVNEQGSEISLVAENGSIKASAIVTAINGTSGIALDADHITLNGDTTINAINGATGTVKINANRVNMTGVLTWNNISGKPDVLIEDDADTESYITTITENTVTAEYINAFELQATNLYGTDIYLQRTQDQLWANGHIYITGSSSSLSAIELNSAGALRLVAEDGAIYFDAFSYCGTSCELSVGGDCYPSSNGSYDLGTSSFRWSDVWCTTGVFNGSDRRIKNSISDDLAQYEVMFNGLKPVKYKLNSGTSGRYHIGFIAQDVEEALAAAKLDSADFGGFGRDKDEHGNEILSLRYSEFIALNTLMIQKLTERVNELEQRLAEAS